ncbi:MAG TPA: hypothetical protein ENN55_03380 [Firmicutes bacterium]|nr:hypothetical protein [Bacillota bacterium]
MLILAPIAAVLVQMMISRNMEYNADNRAAKLTGRPQDLISALEKIHAGVKEGVRRRVPTHASPSNQHMLIASPFLGGMLGGLFSTHPSLEQRRAALRKLMK